MLSLLASLFTPADSSQALQPSAPADICQCHHDEAARRCVELQRIRSGLSAF
ncbi:hypothetical protein [Parachitinimonas caeni]|uniref:Uncharacterized protein n=1 Tax=Parachitinimonas caeni TaxID=3031301 RepID=A0ABT7DZU3_9NEIS|nr:hypothetical protein [Parachitinimonas caeni]MDK2125585.1 hypothetical protein [Parachitinimonas caeni]